jgi:HD-GYP domain-containing protein (c-di-GMP phosphodiesterase class II)
VPPAQIRSFAAILRDELGAAFAFYDASSGEALAEAGLRSDKEDSACRFSPAHVRQMAANRWAQVTPGTRGGYHLWLPLGRPDVPGVLAVGFLTAFARTPAEAAVEQARLEKWAQSVCERINMTLALPIQHRKETEQEGAGRLAWEALVALEQLTRRLRVHKDVVKHQKRILRTIAETVRVEAVLWVPERADADVLVEGKLPLSPFDLRQLAHRLSKSPDLEKSGLLLVNDVAATSEGACFPQVHNLLACTVRDHGVSGLLLALNKRGRGGAEAGPSPRTVPFRRGDLLALSPFAALFGLHAGSSLRYHDLKDLLVGMTRSLTSAIDAKDAYTFGHSERVGRIAVELGRALGLSEDELSDLYLAGLMHDVGKIGIRDAVLCKREPLTAEEVEHLKQHVTIGHAIVADLHPIRHLLPGILYHHERLDGTGYPEGLRGDAIPLLARILAVADGYDAMTTTRPYRKAMTHERAGEILREGAGTQWDGQIVDAFFRCRDRVHIIRQRGVGESLRQALDAALRNESSSRLLGSMALVETT